MDNDSQTGDKNGMPLPPPIPKRDASKVSPEPGKSAPAAQETAATSVPPASTDDGAVVTTELPVPEKKRSSRRGLIFGIIGGVILLLIIAALCVLYFLRDDIFKEEEKVSETPAKVAPQPNVEVDEVVPEMRDVEVSIDSSTFDVPQTMIIDYDDVDGVDPDYDYEYEYDIHDDGEGMRIRYKVNHK